MNLYQSEQYLAEKPLITVPKMTSTVFSMRFESKFGKLNKSLDAKKVLDYLRENASFATDCTVDVGFEHFGIYTTYCNLCKDFVGLTGVTSGDAEYGVFFIIYFDGKRFRIYFPTAGNFFNIVTMTSFGRENVALVDNKFSSGVCIADYNAEAEKHLHLKDFAVEQDGNIALNDDNCVRYGAHDMIWVRKDIENMFEIV